jgi:simple sugar transport system ATP-binding protein
MDAAAAPVVLRLTGIAKRFGAVAAVDGVDLQLARGEVVALLGENGAGKTTLMNVLFGHYVADEGRIEAFGRPLPPGQPRAALAAGVAMVHQHFTLADDLSVLENVVLGTVPLWRPGYRRAAARARVRALADRFGLAVDPDARAGDLGVGVRQRAEILKALYRDARVLILDEPTAVLTPQEAEALFATLRRAVAEGLSAIFISHKLGEVMAVADRVVVLRQGRVVGARGGGGPVLLALEAVRTPDRGRTPGLRGVDLTLRAGRITGLAGVSGNGQAALAALLAGLARPAAGRLLIDGRPVGPGWSPRAALAAGIARIPEDRHRAGTVADMTVAENAILEAYAQPPFARAGVTAPRAAEAFAARLIADFDVRGGGPRTRAGLLSGGNLQKLILGRALAPEPRAILADQPTRGLDVGAVAYVQARLLAARDRGAAILLISEDLDEIGALADVIHVVSAGRLSPPFPRGAGAGTLGPWMAGQGFGPDAHAA